MPHETEKMIASRKNSIRSQRKFFGYTFYYGFCFRWATSKDQKWVN